MQIFAHWASTLKFKIVAMAMVTSMLAAAGAAWMVLDRGRASMSEVLLDSARDDRERTAALLGSKVQTLQSALAAVARHVTPAHWRSDAAMAAYLADKPAIHTMFDSAFVADRHGRILARTERGRLSAERPDVSDREYFQRAMRSDQPVISAPLVGRVTKTPLVIFAVPVLGPDGQAIGIVGGSAALQSNALFADVRSSGLDQGTDIVVDRQGTLLGHPDGARLMGRAADEPGLAAFVADWLAKGSPIDTEARALIQGPYLVSAAGIPLTDWMVVRTTPAALAFKPVDDASATAWKAALAAGGVAVLLSGALAYALTRPIWRLHTRALALLDPARAGDPWPSESGEIGALARVLQVVVRQREQRQSEVQALVTQLEAILDHTEVGIALTRHGRFELVSRQFGIMFRCSKDDAVDQPTRFIYPSDDAFAALQAQARPAFLARGAFDGELQLMRRGGELFWARLRGRAVVPGDVAQGTIWTIEDVTATREHREKLSYEASHDALTALANRAAFEAALDRALAEPEAHPLSVLFIDLDRFKQVNDSSGHAAGDALLREVAAILKAQVRRTDLVARLGGDEFAVLLPHCPEPQGRVLADKLCDAVSTHEMAWEGTRHSVGASVGLTVVSQPGPSAADILRAADNACYLAKRRGRGRVEAHAPSQVGELDGVAA